MKKLLALLSVGMILVSFAMNTPALGQESSSPDPADRSMQQCDQSPNYGTQINFEGWNQNAPWTVIDVQYLGQGVAFGTAAGCDTTVARTDGARPGDNLILACYGLGWPFSGDICASFWLGGQKAYVTQVGATVGWCNTVGAVTMKAYNCDGAEVGSYSNTITGIEFFSISAPEIHKVRFFNGIDPAGADIDCFTYDEVRLCEGAVPTLTEWGLIIFGVLLIGFITYVFLRRRRTAVSYQ